MLTQTTRMRLRVWDSSGAQPSLLPFGLQPGAAPLFNYRYLRGPLMVSDLAFLPRETPFLRQCREQGCRTMNGLGMLLHQAVLSFESWTRQQAPVELLRTTMDAVLREREQRAATSR